eukprot:2747449-Rhodomonas_salina.3
MQLPRQHSRKQDKEDCSRYLVVDKALAILPGLAVLHTVHRVPHFDAVREGLCPGVQLLAEEDVVGRLVRIEQVEHRRVLLVP